MKKLFFRIKSQKQEAFTLAEVLITLGIIGIVAAMTLPALMEKQNEKARVTQLKKTYSILQQAHLRAIEVSGEPDGWGTYSNSNGNSSGATNILNVYKKHLKIIKNCGTGQGCFKAGMRLDNRTDMTKIILADGTNMAFSSVNESCDLAVGDLNPGLFKVCGWITVDLNGTKKPNIFGEDTFEFYITKFGIVPYGTRGDGTHPFARECLMDYSATILNGDKHGCTGWVLQNNNQDYLHCAGLALWGKKECK